jgi:tellurite resistance protein
MLNDWRPDDEMLAAFIDGRLSAAERDRVMHALASDPEQYSEFLEAAQIADAARGEAPARSAESWRRAMTYAVPILAAASVATLIWLPGRQTVPDTIDLMQSAPFIARVPSGSAPRALPTEWEQPGWSVVRGGREQVAGDGTAARLGVRLVQLEFASAAEDSAAVERIAPEIVGLLGSISGAGPAGEQLRHPKAITTAERALIARMLRTLSRAPAAFDAGAWIEMARLSAATDREQFFAEDGGARRSLRAVTTAIADGGASPQEWSEVLPHLRTIDRTSAGDLSAIRLQLDSAMAALPTR